MLIKRGDWGFALSCPALSLFVLPPVTSQREERKTSFLLPEGRLAVKKWKPKQEDLLSLAIAFYADAISVLFLLKY